MKNSIRTLAMLGLAAGIAMAGTARADDAGANSDNQTSMSQDQQDNTEDQIEALRETLGTLKAQQDNIDKLLKNWINVTGDIRFRYESNDFFYTPGSSGPIGGLHSIAGNGNASYVEPATARILNYERYRIRARLVDKAHVNDFTTAVVRLTTEAYLSGNAPYGQPNTANQTLNSYGDKDPASIDKAYIDVAPQVVMMPELIAGVQGMPFLLDGTNGNLIFDDNLTDGGLSFSLMTPALAGLDLRAIGAQFINEDGKGGTAFYTPTQHPEFEGEQVVLDWNAMPMGQKMGLSLGVAYYDWRFVKDTAIFTQGQSGGGTYINSAGANGLMLNDFCVDDYLATYNTMLAGLNVKAFYEYERNTVVAANNVGYLAGGEIASGDLIPWSTNEITLGYNYRVAQTDSTLCIWNDGDFNAGGTDAMGGKFYAKVMVGDNLWVSVQNYNDRGNLEAEAAGGRYSMFQRTQVDLNAKF